VVKETYQGQGLGAIPTERVPRRPGLNVSLTRTALVNDPGKRMPSLTTERENNAEKEEDNERKEQDHD